MLIQVGDYDLGDGNIDRFLFGPEVVVYGDGTVIARRVAEAGNESHHPFRYVQGHVSEAEIQTLLAEAAALPLTDEALPPADQLPLRIRVGEYTHVFDAPTSGQAGQFLDAIRRLLDRQALTEWNSDRWIERLPDDLMCSGVTTSDSPVRNAGLSASTRQCVRARLGADSRDSTVVLSRYIADSCCRAT